MVDPKKQVTWGGRFEEGPADLMLRIGESVSFDQRLAKYDIQGSCAHAKMLAHIGILTQSEANDICNGLDKILLDIEADCFEWNFQYEDVHMNIEQALTQLVPVAAKLHTARSRNDQVATDMRLWFKDSCERLDTALTTTIAALVDLAERNKSIVIPGYTHLQRAQPLSIAHHLLAYVEMLDRDRSRISMIFEQANMCPLGSCAIAGTTLPIDREFVALELGFTGDNGEPNITQNSIDAVSDRDLFIDYTTACATIGIHLSRLAEDFIIWSSSEFSFIHLPDAYSTGSSLMPQKKNPDAFELIRGKAARLTANVQAIMTLVKGLPLSYNRDLQEDKPPVFDSFDTAFLILETLSACLPHIEVNKENCAQAVADPNLLATDLVDYLVLKGLAFREAHHVVGKLVALSDKIKTPLNELPYDKVSTIHPDLDRDWSQVFNIDRALNAREQTGMPGPKTIASRLAYWKAVL